MKIKHKEKIAQRKSQMSQMQSQLQSMEGALKDKDGTIETLERQLVQAGIKAKVMQGAIEVNKKTEQLKGDLTREYLQTEAEQKLLRGDAKNQEQVEREKVAMAIDNTLKGLSNMQKNVDKK